jgi:hypothetical protein
LDDLSWLSQRHDIFEVVLPDCEQAQSPDFDFQSFCQRRALRLTKLGLYEPDGNHEKLRSRAASV